jgi:arylsulfatase A-like enzyme
MIEDQNSPSKDPKENRLSRRRFFSGLGGGVVAGTAVRKDSGTAQESVQEKLLSIPGAQRELEERAIRSQVARGLKQQKGNGLNLIVIVADTWRTDHLGCYGGKRALTPNLDALAGQSILYQQNFADGLATIPARRVYHTGKSILPRGGWIPIPAEQPTLAQILKRADYWCGLIADVFHYFKPNMNLHVDFDTWEWIRGQESDPWKGGPPNEFDPRHHMPADLWNPIYDKRMRQYLRNTRHVEGEDDYFCARTVKAAMKWLDENHLNRPFLLWVEIFDPHEPWDPPSRFAKMYREDFDYDRPLFGYGVQQGGYKPDFGPHLDWIQALYAGEVTFTDHWIGNLLEHIEELKLLDDTIVFFTSDHGTHLGELGYVQKQPALLNSAVMHVPAILKHPERSTGGIRCEKLNSVHNYGQTFCSVLGLPDQPSMDGQDMLALALNKSNNVQERVFTLFSNFASVRDRRWHYFQHISGEDPGAGPCLYDLETDPEETKNLAASRPEVADEMREQLTVRLEKVLPKLDEKGREG